MPIKKFSIFFWVFSLLPMRNTDPGAIGINS